ncbi:MAG: hypothetical protein MPJ24_04975 [Pirellulaceae bacterium]|nr:hypothetical protein [Pirellulaceae bacterium]
MKLKKLTLLAATTLCLSFLVVPALMLNAQGGVSSMSMGMSRAGMIPMFNEIRIEEFINYHRHVIPLPEKSQRLRLSLVSAKVDDGNIALQVGLATPVKSDSKNSPRLNLVLVIDHSGSMSGDRIENVKRRSCQWSKNFANKIRFRLLDFQARHKLSYQHIKRIQLKKSPKQ